MYSKRHWRRIIAARKKKKQLQNVVTTETISTEENSFPEIYEQSFNVDELNYELNMHNTEQNDNLKSNLKKWAIKHNLSRLCFDELLTILRAENMNLPLSSKTIVKPQTCVLRTVSPGSYLHIGLKNQLLKMTCVIKHCSSLSLDVNIDGLPLYKSSSSTLWPILARIVDQPRLKVFPIGVYLGNSKPYSVNCYLHDFTKEIADLQENGLEIEGKKIIIKIRCFVCDTPARAFLRQTVGHNAVEGCCKCIQRGHRINNRTAYTTSCAILRSDENFKERTYENFHKITIDENSDLEKLGVGMISQFTLDPMHLVDLGVTKKMLLLLLTGKSCTKLSQLKKDELSSKLVALAPYIPKEFCRKPRGINEINRWKATEFRQFILYTGIIALPDIAEENFVYHFALLHCAYRILMNGERLSSHVETATEMLQYFVESFPTIFSADKVSFNVHALLHYPDCVAKVGTCSAYAFENYLQQLKKHVKKPTKILEQINNKIFFESNCY